MKKLSGLTKKNRRTKFAELKTGKVKLSTKELSDKYLTKAKILGFSWLDLLRLRTRHKVIAYIERYDKISEIALAKYKMRKAHDNILRNM